MKHFPPRAFRRALILLAAPAALAFASCASAGAGRASGAALPPENPAEAFPISAVPLPKAESAAPPARAAPPRVIPEPRRALPAPPGAGVFVPPEGISPPPPEARAPAEPSRAIADKGIKAADALARFFLANNPAAPPEQVLRLAGFYVEEAESEGINSDVAFVQMCLETGFLRYGNLVSADMNNYCGLGAMDAAHRGERFESEALGVRAHIQHLHAYSQTEALNGILIDPRYRYVTPRGKARDVWGLAGTWARDPDYGSKLDAMLSRLAEF